MHSSLLGLLSIGLALCDAAVLPRMLESRSHSLSIPQDVGDTSKYTLNNQFERRSVENSNLVVSLELIDSGYCGNMSLGSKDKSIVTLFDLNTSQLSALAPTVEYCPGSNQCSSTTNDVDCYDPSLSDTATNLSESFEISRSTTTLSGVVYEDTVSIGGMIPTFSKRVF